MKNANRSAPSTAEKKRKPSLSGFTERLQILIDELQIEKKDFAKAGDITAQTLSGYLAGIREPSASVLANWIRTFNININWLLVDDGEMFKGQRQVVHPSLPPEELNEKLTPAQREMLTYKRTMQELGASPERIIDGIEAIAMGKTTLNKSTYKTAESPADPGYHKVHEPKADFGKGI